MPKFMVWYHRIEAFVGLCAWKAVWLLNLCKFLILEHFPGILWNSLIVLFQWYSNITIDVSVNISVSIRTLSSSTIWTFITGLSAKWWCSLYTDLYANLYLCSAVYSCTCCTVPESGGWSVCSWLHLEMLTELSAKYLFKVPFFFWKTAP